MKHTKGPWQALIISDYKPNTITETYIKKIAVVGPVKENGGQSHIAEINLQFGDDQSSANANLVAAAPELLEASKNLLDCLLLNYRPKDQDKFEKKLNDAIAKAELNHKEYKNG